MPKLLSHPLKLSAAVALLSLAALSATATKAADSNMSFFITSAGSGDGANLGGLKGADGICNTLAKAAGSSKTWQAYLSTSGDGAINARDRIGKGPWYNAKGVMVAKSVDHLHSADNALTKNNSLNEKGEVVNGRGDKPNKHDILTGSNLDGTAMKGKELTCENWTSNDEFGNAMVGHHDRTGGGGHPKSWNSAHPSKDCTQKGLQAWGGSGKFYCFATN